MLLNRDLYKTQSEISTLTGIAKPHVNRALKKAEREGLKMLIEQIEDIKLYHIGTLPDNLRKRLK